LSKTIARAAKTPILGNVYRIRRTVSQSGLTAAERRRNLAHAFVVAGRLKCKRPLIIDDVMTTGETCRQLASTLLLAGATQVGVLTVARA
jgi:predicted amidophosphoribosyltransferase